MESNDISASAPERGDQLIGRVTGHIKSFTEDLAAYVKKVFAVRTAFWRRSGVALALALLMAVYGIGWLAFVGWEALLAAGNSPGAASLTVAGVFWLLTASAMAVYSLMSLSETRGRQDRDARLDQEAKALERSGAALVIAARELTRDLGQAAKSALDPKEVLRAHAAKIVVGAAAVGFILGTQIKIGDRDYALTPVDVQHQ